MSYLGIDIGGTYIKYAMFNHEGDQLNKTKRVQTEVTADSNNILQQVSDICLEMQKDYLLTGIAISSAGVVDSSEGMIKYAGYTIPHYTGTRLKEKIEALTNVRCSVINDVNAACLGEYWKSFDDESKPQAMVCLTLGTGLGGAILIDGKLYQGVTYMAGEIGYLPIDGEYFQNLASTSALLSKVEKITGEQISGEVFFHRLRSKSDDQINQIFDEFIMDLSKGILILQYTLNPQYIVLGGGILAHHDLIIPKVEKTLDNLVVSNRFLTAEIRAAQAGNNAGMLGALYYHLCENS